MGEHKDFMAVDITIEQAVKAITRDSGDDEKTVTNALANYIWLKGFQMSYKTYEVTIPEQESVHIECCMPGGAVAGYLFDVAEKGWENVYVDPNPGNTARIFSIDLITKTKGKVIVPKKEIKKKNPETGKEEIICIEGEVRDIKRVVEKYTGKPIPFREFKANIVLFEKLLKKNNIRIPDSWAIDADHLDTVNNLNEFCGMENLHWSEIEIHLTTIGLIVVTARGKTVRITTGKFGLINKNTGAPNQIYGVLVSFAEGEPVIPAHRRMTVKRVRDMLRDNFGINKTPIELEGGLYKPKFKISFSEYKRNRGEEGTVPLSSGKFLGAISDPKSPDPQDIYKNYRMGSDKDNMEDDNADKWLSEHDPHHPEN